jgi:hypothetical protein
MRPALSPPLTLQRYFLDDLYRAVSMCMAPEEVFALRALLATTTAKVAVALLAVEASAGRTGSRAKVVAATS